MISRRHVVAGALATPLLATRAIPTASANQNSQLEMSGAVYPYTEAVVDGFRAAYPDIDIEFSEGGFSFEDGSLQAVLQSGVGPDVLIVNSGPGRVGLLADNGLISPLDDLYQLPVMTTYLPDVLEQIQRQNADGQIYEVVEGLDVFQMYYNTEMFAENGLQPPATWDDFLAICQVLKDSGIQPIVQGIRDGSSEGWVGGSLLQASAGRDVMTEIIYGDGDFTHPHILRAFEALATMVEAEYVKGLEAAALNNEQARAAFANGQAAMSIQPQGFPISLSTDGLDTSYIEAFVLPAMNDGQEAAPTAGLAQSWVANADSNQRDATLTWLQWVASDEYLQIAMSNGGYLVPARSVPDSIALPAPIKDATQKLKNGAGYNPSVYLPAAAKDAWFAALELLFTAQTTPQEAVDVLQAGLEESRSAA